MAFEDHLADLDEAVSAELGAEATFRPAQGAAVPGVRVILERPVSIERLTDAELAKARPTMEVSVADVPRLRKGDKFETATRVWQVAEAPARPGDGRWWAFEVLDLGPVSS